MTGRNTGKNLSIYGFEVTVGANIFDETRYSVNRRTTLRPQLRVCLSRPLSLGQIENECKALVASFLNSAAPISTGTRLPSFRKYFFSKG